MRNEKEERGKNNFIMKNFLMKILREREEDKIQKN